MRSSIANYDSILTATDSNVINRTDYFAQGTMVSDREVLMSERNYTVSSDSGIILLLLVCLGIIASIFHNSRPFIVDTWKQFFKKERKYSVKGVITKNFWVDSMWQIFIASFTLSLSLFDYLAQHTSFSSVTGIPYWVVIVLILLLVLFFIAKLYLYMLVNWVFFPSYDMRSSWTSSYVYLTALSVYPCYVIILFQLFSNIPPIIVAICYILLTILYEIALIFKLFINFKVKKSAACLIFLYLCSVEIVPTIFLWRFLQWASKVFLEVNDLY